jgi:hypothetical protein
MQMDPQRLGGDPCICRLPQAATNYSVVRHAKVKPNLSGSLLTHANIFSILVEEVEPIFSMHA